MFNETGSNDKPGRKYSRFNVFQYYYDPPDAALDPNLVQSIISDTEKPDIRSMDAKWTFNNNMSLEQQQDMKVDKTEYDDQGIT
jgi:hypothetical protein